MKFLMNISAIIFLIACGSSNQSSTKHEYAKVTREHSLSMIAKCSQTTYKEKQEALKLSANYLRKMVDYK